MKFASINKITFRTTHFRKLPQPGRFRLGTRMIELVLVQACVVAYTECKYGGPLGRPGSSCAKARLVRPREFCFDCASSGTAEQGEKWEG